MKTSVFKDVPQLADTIRSKARDYINKNLVSPYKHAFRLAGHAHGGPKVHVIFIAVRHMTVQKVVIGAQKMIESIRRVVSDMITAKETAVMRPDSGAPEMHPAGKHHSNMAPIGSKEGHSPEFDHNERQHQELKTPLRDSVYEEEEEDDDEDESEDGQAQLYTPFSSRSPHGYEKEQSSQTHKALHDSFGDHELTGLHSDEDGDEEDDDDCEEEEEEKSTL